MISDGSCDTEDWIKDAENSSQKWILKFTGKKLIWKEF